MALFRRRSDRVFTEETAYNRCHGDRGRDILRVTKQPPYSLPQRRRGHHVSVAGETLRQAFARKLDHRSTA